MHLYIYYFINKFEPDYIKKLNKNISIIYRNYGSPINVSLLIKIRDFCKQNGRKFYLANNLKLAINLDLDGAYIPSFNKSLALKKYNTKKKFLIMGSAHNLFEIDIKKKQGVDLIFLSPLFQTKNYKKKIGIIKFNILSRLTDKKIIALGGINNSNIQKLKIINACGFSAITYFKMN